jgi:hypothetical protein
MVDFIILNLMKNWWSYLDASMIDIKSMVPSLPTQFASQPLDIITSIIICLYQLMIFISFSNEIHLTDIYISLEIPSSSFYAIFVTFHAISFFLNVNLIFLKVIK